LTASDSLSHRLISAVGVDAEGQKHILGIESGPRAKENN
jgi:transposase-like protein